MEETLLIRNGIEIPGGELWYTSSRAKGPGGQHVNTTNSRVTLYWAFEESTALTQGQKNSIRRKMPGRINKDGVFQVHVDTYRSQYRNRIEARERLAMLIRTGLMVSPRRRPTKPSVNSQQKRLKSKKHRANIKNLRRPPKIEE